MIHLTLGQSTVLLAGLILLTGGCFRNAGGENALAEIAPIEETSSLGVAPTIDPGVVDTIISGSPQAAADALLAISREEGVALVYLPVLLSRLDECGAKIDDSLLTREEGQPIWMRLYSARSISTNRQSRKHQILFRLADCIREVTPSIERAQARQRLFQFLSTEFFADQYCVAIATRSVVFTSPSAGSIRSEMGWDELLDLLSPFISSDKQDLNQQSEIRDVLLAFCRQYPEEESRIVGTYGQVLGKGFAEFLEATKTANFVQPYFSERDYRTLRDKSIPELVSAYAGQDYREARGLIEGLLTGTHQARLESFPLVKPYLKTYRESGETYYHWVSLLRRYCIPVAENASSVEIERQHWLQDELVGQVDRNERGDPKFGTDPIQLLRFMILPVTDSKVQKNSKHVDNPYGKERILEVLLAQTVSTDTHAARSALRELEVLCKFDDNTARSIEQGLTARKESILTREYPSDDLSATSKEDIYKAMELTIKRAQAELK